MNRKSPALLALSVCIALVAAGCAAQPSPVASASPSPVATATSKPAATEPASPSPSAATPAPIATASAVSGLILTATGLPKDVTVVSNKTNQDGSYREELLYDGMVDIVVERVKKADSTADAIGKQIEKLNTVPSVDFKAEKDSTLSTKFTYPAWRVTYTTGANEDTRSNLDIYVQTDEWDFRFHTSTPVDSVDDYKDTINVWIETLNVEDAN